jgi:ATP-binding cassette subfamily F protein 3
MIVLNGLEKQFGAKVIYDRINGAINPANRTGLVGPNGAGKTMLMRIIMGEETADRGEVTMPSDLRLGYLPQEMNFDEAITPLSLALAPFLHLQDLEARLEQLYAAGDHHGSAALDEYARLKAEQDLHGGFGALESRAKAIMAGLGIPQDSWDRPLSRLSGGFRMRVVLAQLLLVNPDFLLLDEPTNHLDYDSLIWLEKFLQKFAGGMLIISHDRDFLDRITDHTVELFNGAMTDYSGTVSGFLVWKEQQTSTEERRIKHIEDQIAKTQQFIDRFKAKNTKAAQARSKEKQLARLAAQMPEKRAVQRTARFSIPPATPCGSVPLKLDEVTVAYDGNPVFERLSLSVSRGDKVAVIGPNGAGKSTLLKACAGLVVPQSGKVVVGHNAQIRYYSQHRIDQIDAQRTLFDTIAGIVGTRDTTFIQSLLGAFLFSGDDVLKTAGVLSGGEKSRLSLAMILANPGNVLLLDEPTNHLDIQTVERLADALSAYDGTILLVSHDEFFISRIANRVVELRPGLFRDFPGAPADYRAYIEAGYLQSLEEIAQRSAAEKESGDDEEAKEERVRKRKERTQLQRRIERTERDIDETEKELRSVRIVLQDPANAANFQLLHETQVRFDALQHKHDTLIDLWGKLQEEFGGYEDVGE